MWAIWSQLCVCRNKNVILSNIYISSLIFRYKDKLKSSPDSQLLSIGSICPVLPWVIRNANKSVNECISEVIDFVKCTHPVKDIIPFVDVYSRMLHAVINGRDLIQEVLNALSHSELGGSQKKQKVLALIEKANR